MGSSFPASLPIPQGVSSIRRLPIAIGTTLLLVTTCHADVIIKLHSGLELRATRTWTEGDTVKAQVGSGVIGLPASAIATMTQVGAASRPVKTAPPAEHPAPGASSPGSSAKKTDAAASGAGAPTPAANNADVHVPEVPGEDTHTKMDRLDALLLKTHRELSIARTQEQPPDVIDGLERKIADINQQRDATMHSLGQR
jgi:hypothetical protein